MRSKTYIKYLENKARQDYKNVSADLEHINQVNPDEMIRLTSQWLDLYNAYMNNRYNSLFLSIVFAYISFNTTSYFENNNDNFFKLFSITTTLFLASISYIQRKKTE
ncbi:hypothetical protein [Enterococcus casseliflavus]|nr:hypothetical protein [Enterococcus casseliflavus]